MPRDVLEAETNILWRLGVELQVEQPPRRRLPDRGSVRAGLRRRLPRAGRVQLQRHGCARRGRRRRRHRRRLPRRARAQRRRARGRARSPSSAAASPPWTPAAPPSARAPPRSPASTAARARRCPPTTPRSTRPRRRASSSSCSCAPVRVVTDAANKVTGIEMQRMELGEPDASGRRRPVPVEGSEFVIECDQVITAIGQYPKLDGTSEEQGVKRTKWRTIEVDDWTFQTGRPARVRRRRRRARRADRHPGHRPGQEGRVEHGRVPARRST